MPRNPTVTERLIWEESGFSILIPPVGLNLFISSIRFEKPVFTVVRATLPYIAILLVALMVITYVPELSLGWETRSE